MKFLEYELTSEILCIGERTKGGLVRPCSKTIRYSLITGALKETFGIQEVHAVGHLIKNSEKYNKEELIAFSPKNNVTGSSKIPLHVYVLSNVLGYIYISKNKEIDNALEDEFELIMGAMRSKGFGRCRFSKKRVVDTSEIFIKNGLPVTGTLNTRVPIFPHGNVLHELINDCQPSKFLSDIFGIKKVVKPLFGYLFQPDENRIGGKYIISLFEGSKIVGPKFLIEEARYGLSR